MEINVDFFDINIDSLVVTIDFLEIIINSLVVNIDFLEITINSLVVNANFLEIIINSLVVNVNFLEITINSLEINVDSLSTTSISSQTIGYFFVAIVYFFRIIGRIQKKIGSIIFDMGKFFHTYSPPRTFGACPSLLKERGKVRLRTSG